MPSSRSTPLPAEPRVLRLDLRWPGPARTVRHQRSSGKRRARVATWRCSGCRRRGEGWKANANGSGKLGCSADPAPARRRARRGDRGAADVLDRGRSGRPAARCPPLPPGGRLRPLRTRGDGPFPPPVPAAGPPRRHRGLVRGLRAPPGHAGERRCGPPCGSLTPARPPPRRLASGRLAQLARAPPLQGGGRGFESLSAHELPCGFALHEPAGPPRGRGQAAAASARRRPSG
jgi:hypothetical protein